MALTTYAELQTALATRLHRADLTANIVDYITIAEKSLNREIGLTAQETEATLTATIGSTVLTPPSLFGNPIALYLTTYLPRLKLEYRLPPEMQLYSSNGPSSYWTVNGTDLRTDTPADIAYTYTFRYSAEYNLASTLTNQLLTDFPDLYFYGALIEAGHDLKDEKAIVRAERRYARALEECANDQNKRRSLAALQTEFGRQARANIIRGF